MDAKLKAALAVAEKEIRELSTAEETYLHLEASRKIMFAQIFMKCTGKSALEREHKAYASEDWKRFMEGHVVAETLYNRKRRMLELHMKACDMELNSYKIENQAIKRQL